MTIENDDYFVAPQDGFSLTNPIGGHMILKGTERLTGGSYSLHENTLPPNSPGPRPHIHRAHEEAFYVLEGELTLRVGRRTILAPAGSFLVVPRGVVHQPSNPGTQPTRVLLIFSPAGMERFFIEAAERRIPLQAVSTDPVVLEALSEFEKKYSFAFAEFPLES
ncbi:MAG TPA: cupin domain-containing protein [Anaerolineae bacterium]|nr:cupin domain-containing protein [Anaerolineae bacterium]